VILSCRLPSARPYTHEVSLYGSCLMAGEDGWDDQQVFGRGAYSDPPLDRSPPPVGRHRPASHTYEAERFQHVLSIVLGVIGVVAGIVALVVGEIQGLIPLGFGVPLVFIGFWLPHRVTLDDSGVLIQAMIRRVRIPWEELETVEPPLWDIRHERLKWRRRRGLSVSTPQTFPELHRMLVEVERRAPHVYVSS
jgi:hypothetical protein